MLEMHVKYDMNYNKKVNQIELMQEPFSLNLLNA